ncbi:UNVERIFIED_CONTAM: hypothetical protein Slati_0021000 [Sesamum latifolium]|uniref:BED-type domain-containing protein n=1 Tax=Sesamum latifolium TaxID=2727402 RepID=A0AAW2Y6C5_9LAMI
MSKASNRKDPGWNYASLLDPNNTNSVKCNFCVKVHKGGITRRKQHLVGGFRSFKPCPKCPEYVRIEIREYLAKKKQLKEQMDAIPHFDDIAEEQEQWKTQQRDIPHGKRPSNVSLGDSFGPAIEALGRFGPGIKPPSYHEVRVTYLKKELEHTRVILKEHDEIKAKYGCSLMADGWTDTRQRRLINFLVNSPKGSKFIESMDGTSYAHTGEKIFELLDKYVQLIGEKDVIQVVTDSASTNVFSLIIVRSKYPHLYWPPCAAHCIDLMFEDIFKLSNLKKTYERGVMINGYIYNRPPLLDIMRDFTKNREMVRPAKTRFATAFLTLKRFHVQKENLRKMFTFERWTKSRYAREAQGKLVAGYILMPFFWNHILHIIKIAGPLVKVLRLVDGERKPPMGYIYEAMDRAKEAIAASFSNIEEKYKDVFALIDARWNVQLHRPLHATSYYLNPEFYYSNPNVEQDEEVMQGLYACIWRVVSTTELQDKIIDELPKYKKAGLFGMPFAIRHRTTKAPGSLTLDSDEENATVFEDDDLTWGDVARAAGVDEEAYSLRSQSTKEPRGTSKASSSKASKKASSSKSTGRHLNLIDEEEEEEEENFDDSEAEYRSDEHGDDGNENEEDYLVESDDQI